MTIRYVDLHMHTRYSDATNEPAGLVRASKMKGVDTIAITDHDHLAAYYDAKDEARLWNIELIPGAEVTTTNYHILGLNVNSENGRFLNFLKEIRGYQWNECAERTKIISDYGVPISMEKIDRLFGDVRLGRHHLLMAMIIDDDSRDFLVDKHGGLNQDYLYKFYLGNCGISKDAYFKSPVSSERAINEIHLAGGIAVIAHPFKDLESMAEMDILVEQGIDAIEIQSNFGMQNEPFRRYGLMKGIPFTYGSDFHGAGKPRPLLGRGENRMENLDSLLVRHRKAA